MVYEFVDNSHTLDENVLVVDFRFDSDVSKEQAIKIVDKIISYADNEHKGPIAKNLDTNRLNQLKLKDSESIFFICNCCYVVI